MNDVTAQFANDRQRRRLERRFGSQVEEWLAELPSIVEKLASEWRLTVEGPAPHGRTSVVVCVLRSDGAQGVLKLSPDTGLAVSEARLLRMWEASGRVPRVWGVDGDRGAILMEWIDGDTIAAGGEVPPMETIGSLIAQLHGVEVPRSELLELRPLTSRVQFVFDLWNRERAEGPAADVVSASAMHQGFCRARDLANGTVDVVPVHGDLHPGNVLDGGERGLVAVDPRACLGDGAVDAVDWALWKATSLTEVVYRVDKLSRILEVDGDRLMAWVRAFAPCLAVAKANRGHVGTDEFDMLMELSEGLAFAG
ncbi:MULTISPECIES: aminoglycoside phosphotransferase family protein [Nocardiopsis]|uniref:Aminoglycoside resistance protein n=1 Tax=Nocardiopsis sinuspersici TaxID=501010 RepID=A0A1V3BVZ6_9ACTN|nr:MULTISPECIES: aminoglycoside phosphotransferase family protein [Nocardiopsis]NYH53742.1 streptomycin 6-kinase [Nocardiopsis sinuspersici]OOC52675.1 aminoglycoside resistance protein [Nocardiopsis sinuspersici]